ncbi:MAG: HAMP domain-containing protein [Verrucomicrobia bacterium]|nr:HAMP domain-containing protein [Verrucomicrobiota bacterium]
MWQLSIRSKIILVLLLTGLACLAAGAVIGYLVGEAALTRSVEGRLTILRELKRRRVEAYVNNQLRFTTAVATSAETVEATKAFIAAFREMRAEIQADPAAMQADTAALETWYNKDLIPRLDKIAGGHMPLEGLMPADPVARRLQADYIARNPNPVGKKNMLLAAPGGSRYDAVHARYHPMLKRMADTVGFYDINILDAATGDVVYTVVKETDFASNMYHGPYTQSGFARAVQRSLDPRNGGKAVVEDYTAYIPSALAPQMFAAVPIIAEGQTIGVFVAQIDILTLNNLLTDNNAWSSTGQGETGEVLLVGEDRLLRSQSRFLIENPDKFVTQAEANGLSTSTANQIRTLGTTILYMPERSQAVEQSFRNQTGLARYPDYRGVEVIAAYGPVEAGGLRWAIVAKQDVAEALAPATRLERDLLVAAAVAAIVLTFLALVCAGLFMRPLRRVVAGMQRIAGGAAAARIEVRGNDEFAELARGFNGMADAIEQRDKRLAEADQEKGELLRSIYPAGVAERLRSGAEITAETVPNVTVVVAWVDGLDTLSANRSAGEVRAILNQLLDTLHSTAATHSVELLRSLGESYIGVCGLSSPRLDHATRTLAWARTAFLAVQRLADDWAKNVSLRFGLASGEIDVLLMGRGHTAYDIWGGTLSVCRLIAVEAQRGCVRLSDSTYGLLTNVDGFEPCPPIVTEAFGAVNSWSRPVVEKAPVDVAVLAEAQPGRETE